MAGLTESSSFSQRESTSGFTTSGVFTLCLPERHARGGERCHVRDTVARGRTARSELEDQTIVLRLPMAS